MYKVLPVVEVVETAEVDIVAGIAEVGIVVEDIVEVDIAAGIVEVNTVEDTAEVGTNKVLDKALNTEILLVKVV
jgi:hypothetical protein